MTVSRFVLAVAAVATLSAAASAQVTTIIGGPATTAPFTPTIGNGNFQADTFGVGGIPFASVSNWHNLDGDELEVNFGSTQGFIGSPEPNSQGAFFSSFFAGNDTSYTITADDVGQPFNVSLALHQFGPMAAYDGDEVVNAVLFEVPDNGVVDASTAADDINPLASIGIPVAGVWLSESRPNFYTVQPDDVGRTVFLGLDFENPTGGTVFPRTDVVSLTLGTPTPFVFEFDAAQNPVDGTTEWQPNLDRGAQPEGLPTQFFTFDTAQTANVVSDPSVPGITASYSEGGIGRSPSIGGTALAGGPSAFEIWFEPDSLTGGEQVIAEFGGGDNGSYISLDGDTLSFFSTSIQGGGGSVTLSTTLSSAEWTQVVANWDGDAGVYELFVNGVSVDLEEAGDQIGIFAGGNLWGLGQVGGEDAEDLAAGGPLTTSAADSDLALAGEIGIFRFYDSTLSDAEVLAAFEAITTAVVVDGVEGDFNGDGVVDAADFALFRDNFGGDASAINDNGSQAATVVAADFGVFTDNFGNGSAATAPATAASVPEPSTAAMLVGFVAVLGGLRSRTRSRAYGKR